MDVMKTYSLTDLSNKSGEIAEAAAREPVEITSRGKRKFVLMPVEHYDELSKPRMQRRVVNLLDLSEEDANFYIAAYSQKLAELEADQ
jgi:antitoxin Phd